MAEKVRERERELSEGDDEGVGTELLGVVRYIKKGGLGWGGKGGRGIRNALGCRGGLGETSWDMGLVHYWCRAANICPSGDSFSLQ